MDHGRGAEQVVGADPWSPIGRQRPRPQIGHTYPFASCQVSVRADSLSAGFSPYVRPTAWSLSAQLSSSPHKAFPANPLSIAKDAVEMTMDIRRRMVGDSGPYSEPEPPAKPPTKRSFDVAFLMAPDDSSKKRHQEELKEQLRLVTSSSMLYAHEEKRFPEIGLLMPSPKEEFPKSAFTKVNKESVSPGPAEYQRVSPDLSPNSRSPSYYPQSIPKYVSKSVYFRDKTSPELEKGGVSSKRLPEMVPYGGLAMAFPFPPPPAILTPATALIPSSLAALTLPAQNVCAKCNISFRMTSDLVYHMRCQHKSDHVSVDSGRRRREQDKLRCPVCNETFRERHHLTRHMTAHQDKDGDKDADEEEGPTRRRMTK